MTELLVRLMTAGYAVTFEDGVPGEYFVLLRECATNRLVNCVISDSPESALRCAAEWEESRVATGLAEGILTIATVATMVANR
jgi:hypothetical protein